MPTSDTLTVAAETAYPSSVAAPRIRLEAFAPHLVSLGVDLRYRPALSEREYALITSQASPSLKAVTLAAAATRLAFQRPRPDPVMVHRLRFPVSIPGIDPPRQIAVYDFDDALFVGSISAVNERYGGIKREAARCVAYMRRAHTIVAGNAYLAGHARAYARRVEVIPSCVDPWLQPMREHRATDSVTVGWIGAPSTSVFLRHVLGAFARFNRSRVRARLLLIGADRSITAPWIEHRTWSLRAERDALKQFDIGIMPMPENDWTRGKCGYKLLQYFSAGVPAIASPVGVSARIVGSERGILASSSRDWERALGALAADWEGRRQMGAEARSFVEREFSYQRWAPELAAILRSA